MEELGRGYSKIREQLLLIYGPEIADDPLVGDIFYPLSTQYPFLSSEEQIAVQNMQFEMQRYAAEVQSSGGDIRGMRISAIGGSHWPTRCVKVELSFLRQVL